MAGPSLRSLNSGGQVTKSGGRPLVRQGYGRRTLERVYALEGAGPVTQRSETDLKPDRDPARSEDNSQLRSPTTSERPIRVVLELDRVSKPIEGRLWSADGPSQPFAGWLGLIQILQVVLEINPKMLRDEGEQ